jgi:tryptophan synthase beta chain
VLLHQTIIGLEAKKQLKVAGEKLPDIIIGCAGGGSNFAGLAFPFTADKINGANIKIMPVEPSACPSMTRGPFRYDFGDTACTTPLLAMHTLGHAFIPQPIHAGGLRYHGMAPLVCQSIVEGLFEPKAYQQLKCYEAALTWARTEGSICAPETSHAIAAVLDEAQSAKQEGKEKVILFNYSGHGLMDLSGYDAYLSGKLSDYDLPEAELQKYINDLEKLPKAPIRKTGKW